jgi:signal transduction histidine kinase
MTIPFPIAETVALLAPEAFHKGLLVLTEVADVVPELVRGDQLRLSQVLTNLIGNAIKFTEQGTVNAGLIRVNMPLSKCLQPWARLVSAGITFSTRYIGNFAGR